MALPKIDIPTYDMIIPSTDKKIKYRPFLVKEEKILMMALEGKDQKEMAGALKQIINNCCLNDIDVDKLAPFDLEFFFLQLRGKSIGNTIDLTQPCQSKKGKDGECKNIIEFTINVDDIKVIKNPDHTNKIDLTSTIGIMMKYPEVEDIMSEALQTDDADEVLQLITKCMESIYDDNTVYKMKDTDQNETKEFLEGLTQEQFMKIREFFDTMPKIRYETTLTCSKCKGKNKIEVEGLQNFFG